MGAVVTAPLSAAATFLGGCCGTFAAGCCCRLAGSGQVSSEQAARSVLLALQVFTAAVAALVAATSSKWLPWTCGKLKTASMGDLGICSCAGEGSSEACFQDQLVYRMEASGVLVFAALLLMTAGGCAEGASRTASVAKFMAVLLIAIVLLFVPNTVLSVFGATAQAAAAVFLVVQAVLLIDFAYTWNEVWYANALQARRVAPGSRGFEKWQVSILVASAALFLASVVGASFLFEETHDVGARSINATALAVSLVLLVLSITDYVQHGALLTSCVVMAYTTWLVWETMAVQPSDDGDGLALPAWARLTVCSVSLLSFWRGAGGRSGSQPEAQASLTPSASAAATGSDAGSSVPTGEGGVSASDKNDFMIQCAVHAAAGLYITAAMAPQASDLSYGVHAAAIYLSLALYGWSLVAPYVLTSRSFG